LTAFDLRIPYSPKLVEEAFSWKSAASILHRPDL
jgi:hypothetical protein